MNLKLTSLISDQRSYFLSQATKSVSMRKLALKRLADAIRTHERLLFDALYADLHKSEFEAYSTEIGIVLAEISTHIRHLSGWAKPQNASTPVFMFPSRSKLIHEPYGVVLIVSPWNYPFQLVMSPLIGAISAGNCAVIKPSPQAPATAAVIEIIISEVFDAQYVAVVHGEKEVMNELLNERFDYIFFTGSSSFGKQIMASAARWLTPMTLELGGKSPCIVDEDADIEVAARRIVWGKFLNAGQTCVAPDYIFAHKHIKDRLIHQMKVEIGNMFGANPQHSPDYGRIINEAALNRLISFINQGNVVVGGQFDLKDNYIAPTIIDDVQPDFRIMQEEIFGPILPVMIFENRSEVVDYLKHTEKPLALYYFTQSQKNAQAMLSQTSSGGVCINDVIMHVANDKLPFGGVGNSGFGNYHGKYSFLTFSHSRAVISTSTFIDIKMRYAPFNDKIKWLKRFFN